MEVVNNNKEPITIFQYKYHEGEYRNLLSGAFQDFTKDEENITIVAKEKSIIVQRNPLVLFSPVLRSILDSLSCCSKPALSLPEVSSTAVQHLLRIVMHGETEFMGELNTAEIIVAAKCLQIDLSNFEYLKRQGKRRIRNVNSFTVKSVPSVESESNSDLDEDEVDDYGEDDEIEDMQIENGLQGATTHKTQMKNFLDDTYDEQETLNEKSENRLFLNRVSTSDLTDNFSRMPKGLQTCEVCHKNSRNLSFLWQHYCKSHFMKQLKSVCLQFANDLALKCELCGEISRNMQDLYLHIGIVHEKLNIVLVKHGYKPLVSLNNEYDKIAAVEGFKNGVATSQTTSTDKQSKSSSQSLSLPVPDSFQPVSSQTLNLFPILGQKHKQILHSGSETWPTRPSLGQNKRSSQTVHLPMNPLPLETFPQMNHSSVQYNPQLEAVQPVIPTKPIHCNPQIATQGQQRPQMGLWAQSAKSVVHNQAPPPGGPLNTESLRTPPTPGGGTTCQICQKPFPSVATISQHYVRAHFMGDLKSDYKDMANIHSKTCNVCGSVFKAVDALFLHIGTVHQKVNEIMRKKGLVILDMTQVRSRKSL